MSNSTKTVCLLALVALGAGCSAEVVPATGRVFLYARPQDGTSLVLGANYTSARVTVDGFESQAITSVDAGLESLEWSVEGGRYGNTTERVATIAIYNNATVVTAKKVAFILPWSGAKRLDVVLPTDCGSVVVPGTSECDVAKLEPQWVDVTKLPDHVASR